MPEPTLLIGEVAARAGVNIQTLRYYERRGLLAPPRRSAANRRQYADEAIRVVRFIKRAQDLGFSLEEIATLLRLREVRGRERSTIRSLAADKLSTVHEKIARLQAIEGALRQLVDSCACADGQPTCPILEALDDDAYGGRSARHRLDSGTG